LTLCCHTSTQSTLDTLQGHFEKYPASLSDVNMGLMDSCEASLAELVTLGNKHKKSNMLMQFVLSRKTQSLIDEAETSFTGAIAKLHLGIAVTQIGVNLRIDENVSLLMVCTNLIHVCDITYYTCNLYCTAHCVLIYALVGYKRILIIADVCMCNAVYASILHCQTC
jgi:hypothetical protein